MRSKADKLIGAIVDNYDFFNYLTSSISTTKKPVMLIKFLKNIPWNAVVILIKCTI